MSFAIYVLITALLLLAFLLIPTPTIEQPGEPVAMNDLQFPTADYGGAIPVLYGTVWQTGNCIYAGEYTSAAIINRQVIDNPIPFTDDEVIETVVGYRCNASFAYVFNTGADKLLGYKLGEEVLWVGELEEGVLRVKTGDSSKVGGSADMGEESNIGIYLGQPDKPVPAIHGHYYKGVSVAYFPGAFIGDNVSTIPKYSFCFHRRKMEDGTDIGVYENGGVNPVGVVLNILREHLGISEDKIDLASFTEAFNTVQAEGLAVSGVITRAKKASDWINEFLRYVDGVIYYDQVLAKISIKLLRELPADTQPIPIPKNHLLDFEMTQSGWDEVLTDFSIEYTGPNREKDKINLENPALLSIVGKRNYKELSYSMCDNQVTLQFLVDRAYAKYGQPSRTIKLKVIDVYQEFISVGSVIRVTDIGADGLIWRVTSIKADSDKDNFVFIEAVEDVFSNAPTKELNFSTVSSTSTRPSLLLDQTVPGDSWSSEATEPEYETDDNLRQLKTFRFLRAPQWLTNSTKERWMPIGTPYGSDLGGYNQVAVLDLVDNSIVKISELWYRVRLSKTNVGNISKLQDIAGMSEDIIIEVDDIDGVMLASRTQDELVKSEFVMTSAEDGGRLFLFKDVEIINNEDGSRTVRLKGFRNPYNDGIVTVNESMATVSNQIDLFVRFTVPSDSELLEHTPTAYCETGNEADKISYGVAPTLSGSIGHITEVTEGFCYDYKPFASCYIKSVTVDGDVLHISILPAAEYGLMSNNITSAYSLWTLNVDVALEKYDNTNIVRFNLNDGIKNDTDGTINFEVPKGTVEVGDVVYLATYNGTEKGYERYSTTVK